MNEKTKKISFSLPVLLFALTMFLPFNSVIAENFDFTDVSEMGIAVCEINTDTIILSNNSDERYYPASITKLLSVLCADEILDKDYKIKISMGMLNLVLAGSSEAGITWGEIFTCRELMYATLLPSGNDAAIALAIAAGKVISQSENEKTAYNAFIGYMNEKAKDLGMSNSHFTNADGYDDENNYSTPADMLLLGKAAIQNETIAQIVSTPKYRITTNALTHQWYNTDFFLHPTYEFTWRHDGINPYYDSRVKGMKTGYTEIGLRCFMFYALDNDEEYIGIVMEVPEEPNTLLWDVTSKIIDFSFDNFQNIYILKNEEKVINYTISNPGNILNREITLSAVNFPYITIDKDLIDNITTKTVFSDCVELKDNGNLRLKSDIKTNDIVYVLNYYAEDKLLASVTFVSQEDIQNLGLTQMLFYLTIIVCITGILLSPIRIIRKKKGRNGRKNTKNT